MSLHSAPSKAFRAVPGVRSGVACFTGTRVSVSQLLDCLQAGYTVDDFLQNFPTVTEEQVALTFERIKDEYIRDDECAEVSLKHLKRQRKQEAARCHADLRP